MSKTIWLTKAVAKTVNAGLTQTDKMPCKSYSLPTVACITGFKLSMIADSVCSFCYAKGGNYLMYQNNIEPAQHARLDSLSDPLWVHSMVASIGNDEYFRWHDSGDLQGVWHLELIVQVCDETPHCQHWLPTREYGFVKAFIAKHGADAIPSNLIIRLSAMFPDKPVTVPKSLQGIRGIATSNVHTNTPIGQACIAPTQKGKCLDCRACWSDVTVSYALH